MSQNLKEAFYHVSCNGDLCQHTQKTTTNKQAEIKHDMVFINMVIGLYELLGKLVVLLLNDTYMLYQYVLLLVIQ